MLRSALLAACCCCYLVLATRTALGEAIHVPLSLAEASGTEGGSVTLNCTGTDPDFSWLFIPDHVECKGDPAEQDVAERVRTERAGKRCALTVSNLRFTDSGIFMLQRGSEESSGDSSGDPSWRVESDWVKTRLRVSPDCSAKARIVVDPPGPVTPSSNLSLTCQLGERPEATGPRITWTLNGASIPSEGDNSSSPVRIVDSGLRVEITDVQARRQGAWKCEDEEGRAAASFCLTFSTTHTSSRWRCPDLATATPASHTTGTQAGGLVASEGPATTWAPRGGAMAPGRESSAPDRDLPAGFYLLAGAAALVVLSALLVWAVRRSRASKDKEGHSIIGTPHFPHRSRFPFAAQESYESDSGDERRLYALGPPPEHPEPVYAAVRPHPRGPPPAPPEVMLLVASQNQDTFYGDGGLIRVNPIYHSIDLDGAREEPPAWRRGARLCSMRDNPAYESVDSVDSVEHKASTWDETRGGEGARLCSMRDNPAYESVDSVEHKASTWDETRGGEGFCAPEEFTSQDCIYEVLRM
ncbi:uncharacterized protein LOC133343068 isoform X2 [Lethenteron reissneri]|uniref:uncharacterized protein LOC133343068 isoform X2 n=1 Tax=Lethenteron reissneri TaxID=7753 RepID=UPI002AB77A6B|nr:uncharacterized protein LOC133343068 isoform X2 [Lethenteron reissneri]